jgi:hypothetical protein
VTRRSLLLVGGTVLVSERATHASTTSIARELRRMVGFHILAADDVRQSWQRDGARFIELRQSGLFRQTGLALGVDPPGFTEAIVFAKPRTRDYRLLIDGEFYHVVAHE